VVPHKNSNANSTRFSTGPSAYLYDILSPLFEKTYAVEASKNFKSFFDATPPVDASVTPAPTPLPKTDNKINIDQLTGGFVANKWKPKDLTPADYIYTYTKLDHENAFTFREFVFFEIEFVCKRVEDAECINCFEDTRKAIKEFFEYADCADKGKINAEALFKAVLNL